ncbi:hypothetical protein DQ04_19641000 [Trypanosoma grayi]|uniref:hypothetical protein n=1 Tax=Trypanosoma grayi TaxID=71804 RepID=UPI0004F474F5|nr:hypothetical protein DQ04_19641000 [Trypanosoma grayi]KEG05652.1 hypothetical protein DQ04_19641000 [Trypanosoma grayi]
MEGTVLVVAIIIIIFAFSPLLFPLIFHLSIVGAVAVIATRCGSLVAALQLHPLLFRQGAAAAAAAEEAAQPPNGACSSPAALWKVSRHERRHRHVIQCSRSTDGEETRYILHTGAVVIALKEYCETTRRHEALQQR